MDPDKVDVETGNFWRALYKLEKQFNDVPNAQKIAARVNLIAVAQYMSKFLLFYLNLICGHNKLKINLKL